MRASGDEGWDDPGMREWMRPRQEEWDWSVCEREKGEGERRVGNGGLDEKAVGAKMEKVGERKEKGVVKEEKREGTKVQVQEKEIGLRHNASSSTLSTLIMDDKKKQVTNVKIVQKRLEGLRVRMWNRYKAHAKQKREDRENLKRFLESLPPGSRSQGAVGVGC